MICVGSGASSMDLMYLLSTSISMQDFEVFVSFRSGKGLFYGRDFSQEQSVRKKKKKNKRKIFQDWTLGDEGNTTACSTISVPPTIRPMPMMEERAISNRK